jgi:putative NADH-flavin reductase
MRLFVLGGTGMIGSALIERAVDRDHEVTALVRSPQKLQASPRLAVRAGDPTDAGTLRAALPGHDAVLSMLGPRTLGPTRFRANYAQVLLEAMERSGVRRLLMISAAFLFPTPWWSRLLASTLFRYLGRDHLEMERVIIGSGGDWTLIRPPYVSRRPATGRYRVEVNRLPRGGLAISREDLADFLVTEAEQNAHVRDVVGVSR